MGENSNGDTENNNQPPTVSDTRIFVPYFCAGLVIYVFLCGHLDIDPFLILVIVAGLAMGIYPLPNWFYPDKSIATKRSIAYALAAIFMGCTVAAVSFPPQSALAFVSTMIVCPLAFYAGFVAKQLREG